MQLDPCPHPTPVPFPTQAEELGQSHVRPSIPKPHPLQPLKNCTPRPPASHYWGPCAQSPLSLTDFWSDCLPHPPPGFFPMSTPAHQASLRTPSHITSLLSQAWEIHLVPSATHILGFHGPESLPPPNLAPPLVPASVKKSGASPTRLPPPHLHSVAMFSAYIGPSAWIPSAPSNLSLLSLPFLLLYVTARSISKSHV